jgi:hypothetical protein
MGRHRWWWARGCVPSSLGAVIVAWRCRWVLSSWSVFVVPRRFCCRRRPSSHRVDVAWRCRCVVSSSLFVSAVPLRCPSLPACVVVHQENHFFPEGTHSRPWIPRGCQETQGIRAPWSASRYRFLFLISQGQPEVVLGLSWGTLSCP